jgi:serine/threonine-protein kinase
VDRYPVLGELGRGGMGVVLLSRDPELGRELALKVMREGVAARPEVLQRFREEAQVGGSYNTPASSRSTSWAVPATADLTSP